MLVAAIADYRWTRTYSPLLYIGALLLLVLVLTPVGTTVNGSQRWINLGGFNLQPSEIGKVAVILRWRRCCTSRRGHPGR